MDDRKIIGLYFSRNEAAIQVTADKYGKYCFSIAKNILSSDQDSEECVNDTYLAAWNSIPPKNPSSLKLYLAKITRNLSLNRLKAHTRKKRGGENITLALEELGDIPCTDEASACEEELVGHINAFLRSIPSRDSGIFVYRYFFVESTVAIAERFGLTEANVQKILSRTRAKLRSHLESEGYTV